MARKLNNTRNVVSEIERILEQAVVVLPRLLHGTESTTWNLMNDAIRKGYDIRGFEDILLLPDGALARSNAELGRHGVRRRVTSLPNAYGQRAERLVSQPRLKWTLLESIYS
jgi:uncharacterized protein (DUF849 family)